MEKLTHDLEQANLSLLRQAALFQKGFRALLGVLGEIPLQKCELKMPEALDADQILYALKDRGVDSETNLRGLAANRYPLGEVRLRLGNIEVYSKNAEYGEISRARGGRILRKLGRDEALLLREVIAIRVAECVRNAAGQARAIEQRFLAPRAKTPTFRTVDKQHYRIDVEEGELYIRVGWTTHGMDYYFPGYQNPHWEGMLRTKRSVPCEVSVSAELAERWMKKLGEVLPEPR